MALRGCIIFAISKGDMRSCPDKKQLFIDIFGNAPGSYHNTGRFINYFFINSFGKARQVKIVWSHGNTALCSHLAYIIKQIILLSE